jgi:IS4 transposase
LLSEDTCIECGSMVAAGHFAGRRFMLDAIFRPFINESPITVMAGAALSRLLSPARLDALFERSRVEQYEYQLLFSAVFALMASVAMGTKKSIHQAYLGAKQEVGVSAVAVYDKLKGIEVSTSQALVRDIAADMVSLIDQMNGSLPPLLPGYHVKILDGNCIAATHHRIKELRQIAAGALPGKSLVVLDADRRLALDVFPCEDGHAQERAILEQVLPTVAKNDLWIEDRNFCTAACLWAVHEREAFFIVRQHGNMACQPLEPLKVVGNTETGIVYEQRVTLAGKDGKLLELRRIELHLSQATRDGDRVVSLLTNLPADGDRGVCGVRVAELYRSRWRIETAFQELAEHLNSEINALGYPKAALFGFCVALVIFNALSLMKAALRGCYGAEKIEKEVSNYHIAAEVESTHRGMLIAIPQAHWGIFNRMTPEQFVEVMLMLASQVDLAQFKKHPRGPKKPQPKRIYDPTHPHVATARLLEHRKPRRRRNT